MIGILPDRLVSVFIGWDDERRIWLRFVMSGQPTEDDIEEAEIAMTEIFSFTSSIKDVSEANVEVVRDDAKDLARLPNQIEIDIAGN